MVPASKCAIIIIVIITIIYQKIMNKLKISTLLEYDRAGLKVCHHNGGKATFTPWEQEHKTGLIYSQSQIREETDTNTSLYFRVAEFVWRHEEGPSPKSLDSDENFKP